MKLLLTSAGITNKSISQALENLCEKKAPDIKIGLIPTAANGEPGQKDWLINQITGLLKFTYTWIDIIDFSADGIAWQTRLAECDVIYISGGNTFHLLNQTRKHQFDKWILDNNNKVYVGSSAGSILFTPTIQIATVEPADINYINLKDFTALGLVDFEISPHVPELLTYESNEKYAKDKQCNLYAIDNNTAIEVANDNVSVVTEGEFKYFKYR